MRIEIDKNQSGGPKVSIISSGVVVVSKYLDSLPKSDSIIIYDDNIIDSIWRIGRIVFLKARNFINIKRRS